MTTKQIELVKKLAGELNIEVKPEVLLYKTSEASIYIEKLIAQRNAANKGRASQRQIEMALDMSRCPLLKESFEKELKVIPTRWIEARNELQDQYKAALQYLDQPYTESVYMNEFDSYLDILAKLFKDDIITLDMYSEAFNIANLEMQESKITFYLECNDMRVAGKKVLRKDFFDKQEIKQMQMSAVELANRIAKANKIIEEMQENFDLKRLDRQTLADWIQEHRPEYVEWQSSRLTRSQFNFIKELQKRSLAIVGIHEMFDADGNRIEYSRYVSLNECAALPDDAIKCFSKEFATRYIAQLEKELYDKELCKFSKEGTEETIIEERHDVHANKEENEVLEAARRLYAIIGQDCEDESVDKNDLVEIIKFIPVIMGDNSNVYNMIESAVSKVFTNKEVTKILQIG